MWHERHSIVCHLVSSLGLILVAVGAVVHSTAAEAAGVVILIITLLVVGVALIAVQIYGTCASSAWRGVGTPQSPSR